MYPETRTAHDEPDYTKVSRRVIEEAETFDFLNDACSNLGDTTWNLGQALRKSVYFEEDECDVEEMNKQLKSVYDKLLKILQRRGVA